MEAIRPYNEYEAFESRSCAFDGLMVALEDDNVGIIGVYGMGGVGKTTLVKEVARKSKEKQLFEVVFVAITQTPDMMKTQNEIAEQLGLAIDVRSTDSIRNRLKKNKVVLILDDLWAKMDLEEVGVPSIDERKGCKILMTSWNCNILESMGSQQNFSIKTLEEDEAWNLFKNMAGCIGSDLQSTAKEISKKCAGLPIAIATIAKALKQKQVLFEWKAALQQLSNPSERNFKGIPAEAYKAIELSYKFIETEELGQLFLLCCIMGHNAAIEDLLRYVMGQGLFHTVKTVEKTRDKVLTLVSILKASCLLIDGSDPANFDMHDIVRDVALSIASRDLHWLALGSDGVFKGWPNEETMKFCKLISLQNGKVSDEHLLNHELECPDLTFLSMGFKDSSVEIPNDFFEGMGRLKVLDIAKTRFTYLPSSIGSLQTLSTLRLIDCGVRDVEILGELNNLEILDLRRSRIAMLPDEIGQLTRLKVLDLSGCRQLMVPPNVLSRLSRLEELYLYGSFDRWEVEGENEKRNASVVELQHLSRLTTLELHIPDVCAMPKDTILFLGKLERFKISIGDFMWDFYDDREVETSRMLKLRMKKSIDLVDGIKQLSRKVESLDVVGDGGEMLYDPITEGLPHLKHLRVEKLRDVKVVINSMMKVTCLESLSIYILRNLEAIWERGETSAESSDQMVSFPAMKELDSVSGIEKIWDDDRLPLKMSNFGVQSLTTLTVLGCDKLKYVFTSCMVKNFVQLKTVKVLQCCKMEEVIEGILGEGEKQVFPKLGSLKLYSLPKLKRFCSGINPIEFPSLRELEIDQCYYLKRFHCDVTNVVGNNISHDHIFNQKILFPRLEDLKLFEINIMSIWDNQLATTSCCSPNLQSLIINRCDRLEYLLSHSVAGCLVQLKRLEIINCNRIAEIIQTEEKQEEIVDASILFPKLNSLRMENLPKLLRFSSRCSTIELPNLKERIVEKCPQFEINESTIQQFREQTDKTESKGKLKVEGASGSGTQGESQGMSSSHEIEFEAAQKDLEILELSDNIRQSREAASMSTLSAPSSGAITEQVATIPSMEVGETGVAAMTAIEHGVSKILECMGSMAPPTTIGRIVVHGVCGIGKSGVLRALVNNPKIKQLGFDFVILVTVSKYWTLRKIEDQIIQQLPPASPNSELQILKGKKILLLLDDVWEWADLLDIGIRHLSLKSGSMMVLAARELKACADMEVTGVVEIKPLSKEEAWKLFRDQVGGVADLESIHLSARGIAEGCCGLPLLIIATGRALADEVNATVWKDACKKFSVPGRDITSDMEELIQLLKFSFDRLKSRSLKSCFLHCALFPDDREIDTSKFIEYCIQEGLITGTWSDAHERGHYIVKALRHASLLETTEDGLFIRMPYVMRELALGIISSGVDGHQFLLTSYSKQSKEENRPSSTGLLTNERHQLFLKAAASLTEPPTQEDWEKSKMMFLMDNELSVLPERPNCPELKMLFLQRNYQLRVLPDLFFDNMCCLTVLNLSMTRINYLPKSISKLEGLETLILRDCERVVKLPPDVGSLKSLQVLDLGGTEIIELPAEIAELDSLCHLEVSFYGSSTSGEHAKLPRNLFSRLQALETLRIIVYPGDNWWNKNVESVVMEVSHLNKLTSLSFNFPDVEFLELFLQESTSWKEERLTDFKFIVGRDIKFNASRVPLSVKQKYGSILGQCLRFVNSEMIPNSVVGVLARCTAFYLDHHLAVIDLSEFGIHHINKLKYCIVSECPCLETITAVKEETEVVFPCLEHLSIHYCWSLTCIWKGVRPQRIFEGLKTLSLSACPKLTYVFETSMLRFISNLEKLEVDDCEAIKKIVSSDEENTDQSCRVSLKSLRLHHLPELVHVEEGVQTKLLFEYISIFDCPQLKLDYADSELKDTLKGISADKDWWDGLEWEDTSVRLYFESIFTHIPNDSVLANYQGILASKKQFKPVKTKRKDMLKHKVQATSASGTQGEAAVDKKAIPSVKTVDGLVLPKSDASGQESGSTMHQIPQYQQPASLRRSPSVLQKLKSINLYSYFSREKTQGAGKTIDEVPTKIRKLASVKSAFRHFEADDIVEIQRPATEREGKDKDKATDGEEDEDDVDAKAADFIKKFHSQLKLDALVRYKEMVNRGNAK